MAKQQNLTVRLDVETIRQARILAARRGTSISQLVADKIAEEVGESSQYERDRAAALAYLERGFHMGGGKLPSRDELHERKPK